MEQYCCKYQATKYLGKIARPECEKCTCDPVNNVKCPGYRPMGFAELALISRLSSLETGDTLFGRELRVK